MSESNQIKQELVKRLGQRNATIGIVGLGYVGLPLVLRFCEVGYKVIGFDIDESKIDLLMQGKSYIEHISSASVGEARKAGFEATTDFSRAGEADALVSGTALPPPEPVFPRYVEPATAAE